MGADKIIQQPQGVQYFDRPMLVRHHEAVRFLWGDEESGQVSDIIYGRGDGIASLTFSLAPGGYFKASKAWKPMYDQDRFYYVVQGSLTIHDPERGEVAVAEAGEAIHWRGAKWHFGYNFGQTETVVLDWYAPQDRSAIIPEIEHGKTKPELINVVNGRYDLLGKWPAALPETRDRLLREGGMVTLSKKDALHLVLGTGAPALASLFISTELVTAGTMELRPGAKTEPEVHPGDEVLYVTEGRLHVHLLDTHEWFEVHPRDSVFLPKGARHQYWNYGDRPTAFAFCVAPHYR